MFENSFFNRSELICPNHKNAFITHVCLEHKCAEQPFLCKDCLSTFSYKSYHYNHEGKVIPIIKGL